MRPASASLSVRGELTLGGFVTTLVVIVLPL
jgi:hypothetical protein